MRLLCADNSAGFLSDHQRPRGSTERSEYPLSAGRHYVAVGVLLDENQLSVLVRDDWGGPCFAPAGLFELGVFNIPPDWKFGLLPGTRASGRELWSDPAQAVWGYSELVRDPCHGAGLAERDPSAVAIFAERVAAAEAAL